MKIILSFSDLHLAKRLFFFIAKWKIVYFLENPDFATWFFPVGRELVQTQDRAWAMCLMAKHQPALLVPVVST